MNIKFCLKHIKYSEQLFMVIVGVLPTCRHFYAGSLGLIIVPRGITIEPSFESWRESARESIFKRGTR
jgi:hypothetical protein